MNRKHIYFGFFITSIAIFSSCGNLRHLQKGDQIAASPGNMPLIENNGRVKVDYTLRLPQKYRIPRKATVTFSPRFTLYDHVQPLTPIVLYGKNGIRRANRKTNPDKMSSDFGNSVRFNVDKQTTTLNISDQVPFELWMREAPLVAYTTAENRRKKVQLDRQTLARGVVFIPMGPGPVITREITEPAVFRKAISVCIYFPIDSPVFDPAMRGNRQALDSIAAFIRRYTENDRIDIQKVILTGYASPDGNYGENATLARDRTDTVRDILITRLGIPAEKIETESVAEDWVGLKKLVSESEIGNKKAILDIIESGRNDAEKNTALRTFPEFGYLADYLLPLLRRVVCEIRYTVKGEKTVIVPE